MAKKRFRSMGPRLAATIIGLGMAAAFLAGCARFERKVADVPGPIRYQPVNVYAASDVEGVERVVMLPFAGADHDRASVENLEEIFAGEIRRTGRFGLSIAEPEELREIINAGTISVHDGFSPLLLQQLKVAHDVDAILVTEISHYRPYRPIAIGVRSRMFSLRGLEVIWECDELFDSGDPRVATAARAHALQNSRMEFPLENSMSVLQSPSRFAKYVAGSLYETFPPRTRPIAANANVEAGEAGQDQSAILKPLDRPRRPGDGP